MSERVTMPALGESVTEGTVTRWLKSVGDEVAVDEPLLEVSTDKVDTEVPSPVAGTLTEILVEEDETVEVGADLAVIGDASEAKSDDGGSSDEKAESDDTSSDDGAEQDPVQDESAAEQEAQGGTSPAEEQDDSAEEKPAEKKSSGGGSGGEKVTMPALGESVTEGTITRWLKAEGDEVAADEPLLEVSTDKVDTEVPSPVAGTLTKILVQEDETVEVGAELAVIGGDASGSDDSSEESAPEKTDEKAQEKASEDQGDEARSEDKSELTAEADESADASDETPDEKPAAQDKGEQDKGDEKAAESAEQDKPKQESPKQGGQKAASESSTSSQSSQSAGSDDDRDPAAYVTPLVRKLAQEKGVDLASITGTGVGGRIRKQDVLAAAEAAAAPKQEEAPAEQQEKPAEASSSAPEVSAKRGTTEKMTRMRKLIATRMVESLQTSAQLTTVVEVDVTKIARLRAKAKGSFEQREGTKLSFMPFFALAAVEALKAFPQLNASVEDDSIVHHASENLGIAVDTEKGLYVPVIHDAGDLNIAGLARKIADLAERTRTNKVTPDELGGGTFTLTNTGSRGALFDTPIINQPQVGILGTGAVVKRPVVVTDTEGDETIAIRSMVYLALTYDHRIIDGADAARFLTTVKQRLEEGRFEV